MDHLCTMHTVVHRHLSTEMDMHSHIKGLHKKKKFYFFYKLREVMTRPHFLSSIEGVSLYCPSKANSGVHMGIQLTLPCLPLCPEAREDIWYNSLRTGYVWVSWQGEGDKSIVNQI